MGHTTLYHKNKEAELFFHGPFYHEGPWNANEYSHCKLCKTQNNEGKYGYWAKGLCRSCYRRLSISHRKYNDYWNKFNLSVGQRRVSLNKKKYKDFEYLEFNYADIETVLERYNWRCAYSNIPLQGYNHRLPNAFQLEYRMHGDKVELVPICRKYNCSKKGIEDPADLKIWTAKNNLDFPVKYISAEEYLINLKKIKGF